MIRDDSTASVWFLADKKFWREAVCCESADLQYLLSNQRISDGIDDQSWLASALQAFE